MEPQDLFNQLHTEIAALNAAFIARKNAQDNITRISANDDYSDDEMEQAQSEMRRLDIEWRKLDNAMMSTAEKQIGKGKKLSVFFSIVAKAR